VITRRTFGLGHEARAPRESAIQPEIERESMVRQQIVLRGIRDPLVLGAMRRVPREQFLREGLEEFAYQDTPLPIESDQTISQPFIVAYMTECLGLRGGEKLLEIGTRSGYAAAVLAEIAGEVFTVEPVWTMSWRATTQDHSVVLPSKCSLSASASPRVWCTTPSR